MKPQVFPALLLPDHPSGSQDTQGVGLELPTHGWDVGRPEDPVTSPSTEALKEALGAALRPPARKHDSSVCPQPLPGRSGHLQPPSAFPGLSPSPHAEDNRGLQALSPLKRRAPTALPSQPDPGRASATREEQPRGGPPGAPAARPGVPGGEAKLALLESAPARLAYLLTWPGSAQGAAR